ncbi:VanZ family protein [Brevibacillus massiliensis]|uniref:VanZ family protein n=1 Tax=Brevibacillus massiliensis TaxID=1118054 RepID=UPI000371EA11|nr:VanZ family protein [Brevibacillus massiliensis]
MTRRQFRDALLLLLLVVGLFVSSEMPYEKQDLRQTIDKFVDNEQAIQQLGDISFRYGAKEISVENVGVAGFLEFFVRKGTHFTFFALLTFFAFRLLRHVCPAHAALPWSGLFAVVAAVLDEWHQTFTPGRTGMIVDVVLDTAGVMVSLLLIYLFLARKRV